MIELAIITAALGSLTIRAFLKHLMGNAVRAASLGTDQNEGRE